MQHPSVDDQAELDTYLLGLLTTARTVYFFEPDPENEGNDVTIARNPLSDKYLL